MASQSVFRLGGGAGDEERAETASAGDHVVEEDDDDDNDDDDDDDDNDDDDDADVVVDGGDANEGLGFNRIVRRSCSAARASLVLLAYATGMLWSKRNEMTATVSG
jgi:hypothetical protein